MSASGIRPVAAVSTPALLDRREFHHKRFELNSSDCLFPILLYPPTVRILGIDPGLKLTGFGVIDYSILRPGLVAGGVIRLDEKSSLSSRLVELETELESLFDEYKPEVVAVEQLYAHYAHPRTAILMGHARGVILLAAQRRNLRIEQFAANRIKQSVSGHGHAHKSQMQKAIQLIWNLPEPPEPPDVADALAVALCCGRYIDSKRVLPSV
jgi:crossover junction endodeoxyribonuclease RuvC